MTRPASTQPGSTQPATTRPRALVTGGSRGIGRAIVTELARDHDVLVGGRDRAAVQAVVDQIPGAAPFVCDLTDPASVADAAATVASLDLLVHSAGIAEGGSVAETDRDTWRRLFEVNVVAVADLTRLLLPPLRTSRERTGHQGQIVMLNSGAGFTAGPGGGPYAASKFALRALTDALREEERGLVRVTSIHPGRTDSDMQRSLQASMGRVYAAEEHLSPESVAATVRLAIDLPENAMLESLSIRPVFRA